MTKDSLPYWLVNVPLNQRPSECPEFLIHANAKDRGILSTRDTDYHRQTWPEVREIKSENNNDHVRPCTF